jgi:hypothetical protein
MRIHFVLWAMLAAVSFGCGSDSDDECGRSAPPGFPRGHQDLPPTDPEGNPWPTYSEASAELSDCTGDEGYRRFRGTCSDGKPFLSREGGFTGDTRYYDGQTGELVGTLYDTDYIHPCIDRGVGDSSCERTSAEELVCP